MPSLQEMTERKTWAEAHRSKVTDPQQLAERVATLRREGKTITTINGSFDLLHSGHLHMLYQAAQYGDTLIVALNSDSSIRAYKSPTRPIVPLEHRLQMLAAIGFVDYVTWFDETDPRHILSIIKPNNHVNGSEYGKDCIEADTVISNGGKIQVIELIPGLSTTKLVEKIQTLCD